MLPSPRVSLFVPRKNILESIPDSKSKARVNRFLHGSFRQDDLMGLFLFARDHCDGRESVAEIGHFVAHHHERDKGIVTRSTRAWFAMIRYHIALGESGPAVSANALPSAAQEYFRLAPILIDGKIIKRQTGLSQVEFRKKLSMISNRMVKNANGTWAIPENCTENEFRLIQVASKYLVVRPAFDANRLVQDFVATLRSNGLLTKEESRIYYDKIFRIVSLYAISTMHNCVIKVSEGENCRLKGVVKLPDHIHVQATVPISRKDGKDGKISSSMFSLNIDVNAHCHPELISEKEWKCEVELDKSGRLAPMA